MTGNTNDARRKAIGFRHVMAVYVGNGLEFYDFLVFSYFAVYISRTFYPSDNPTTALLATLATFGAGFLTRPVGAIVIGSMGDRIGRKPAMVLSFTLMGIAITGLALTPSCEKIGIARRCSCSAFARCRASRSAARSDRRRRTWRKPRLRTGGASTSRCSS